MRVDRKDDEYQPEMPKLGEAGYIVGYLYEIGPVMSAGMGPGPLTHTEMRAWQRNTGIRLQPWEARLLRRLSMDYLAESNRSTTRGCKPPWIGHDYRPEPTAGQLALRMITHKEG